MITTEATLLIISITQGLIKLSGRVDRVMAEKEATTGDFILPMPSLSAGPGGFEMVDDLKKLVADTAGKDPDPLKPHRNEIMELVAEDTPDPLKISELYKRFFPKRAVYSLINPDDQFLKQLKQRLPSLDLTDENSVYAAYSIAAGRDGREIGYPWRTALLVVDVLAEFGAANASMFIHDKKIQPIVQSVLAGFSQPDLEKFDTWSTLLRHALGSTLDGLLDSREVWQGENEWIKAAINALVSTREKAGDDYLLGLFQGRGYGLLISEGLSAASTVLSDEDAGPFENIMSDILTEASTLVQADDTNFAPFFQDHWGDLFRAGLNSLEKHGPVILKDESPILRESLMAMVKELAKTTDKEFLSNETLFKLTDAVVGAVAAKPDLITKDIEEPWLKALITSVTRTLGDQGIRRSFSKEGLEGFVNGTLEVFAEHPGLIIENPGLVQDMVAGILKQVSGVDRFKAEAIALAAVEGALDALTDNPALQDKPYVAVLAGFAGRVSKLVADKTITGIQAADIITAGTEEIMSNPVLFIELENRLAEVVVDAVVKAAEMDPANLLYGTILVASVDQLLEVAARHGRLMIGDGSLQETTDRLANIITAGLKRAEVELGRTMNFPALPIVISGLVAAAIRGELATVDPEDPEFQKLFADLAVGAAA